MKQSLRDKKIIIVGAGFGGVRCVLDLAKQRPPKTKIIFISDKPHFEYHPFLYRAVTGHSPLEVCIPLEEIYKKKGIEVLGTSFIKFVEDNLQSTHFFNSRDRMLSNCPTTFIIG